MIIGTIFSGDYTIWDRLKSRRIEVRIVGLDRGPAPAALAHVFPLSKGAEGYAALRNEFMGLVREVFPWATWLLFLDADEFMTPQAIAGITQALPRLTHDCYYFPRVNYVIDESTYLAGEHFPDYQARLIRLASPAHYAGTVHECVEGVTRHPFPGPAVIHHYGLLRNPQHVFNLRKKYAKLQGQPHLDTMPEDYGLYPTLQPKLPIPAHLRP